MADKKLSSVSAVSDASFVYAETSSGETVKISKADLASVVAGLLPNLLRTSLMPINGAVSTLRVTDSGVFQYNLANNETEKANAPVPNWAWGTIAVFGGSWGVIQLATSSSSGNANKLWARVGVDSTWKQIV